MIGELKGQNTTAVAHYYTFTDTEAPAVTAYYRLKQVDFDGKFEYSKIIALYRNGDVAFRIGPNPLSDYVDLQMPPHTGKTTVKLINMAGVEVMRRDMDGSGRMRIPDVARGIYLLRVEQGSERLFMQRIFKN